MLPAEGPTFEKSEIYGRILAQLGIGAQIDEYRMELDQKRDRFLKPDLSADLEEKETEQVFRSFYSAVMTQQNRNWGPKKVRVLEYLPANPNSFYSALQDRSDDEIREFCAEKQIPKWVTRYKRVRRIALRLMELEKDFSGVRRYLRDLYLNHGPGGLVDEIARDKALPGIGYITALNSMRDAFGLDLVKPDVVLRRIFFNLGWIQPDEKRPETFLQICREIGGHRPAVVDHVFWIFGNANGKPAWNVPQHCSGRRDEDYAGCKHPCFCKTYGLRNTATVENVVELWDGERVITGTTAPMKISWEWENALMADNLARSREKKKAARKNKSRKGNKADNGAR